MITDPISDMLTRIRNASMIKKEEVFIPSSKLKLDILKVLKKTGLINDFSESSDGSFKKIIVKLKYDNKRPAISLIERVSKPGRRVYSNRNEIPKVLQGRGFMVISTSKGVMTGEEARKSGLGGELICKVY